MDGGREHDLDCTFRYFDHIVLGKKKNGPESALKKKD